jgi:serine/threonine protein kinase
MSDDEDVVIYQHYYPPGVNRVLASGSSAFIGEIDDSIVLKYPLSPPNEDMSRLEAEKKFFEAVGQHKRISKLKGSSAMSLYLERAAKGNLYQYLFESTIPSPPVRQRLSWCREAAEAVVHVHGKGVVHCDIQPRNLLLDGDLHLKLSDFQGMLLSHEGTVLIDGCSRETTRYYRPRDDPAYADTKTYMFALGCTIYFIIMGHNVFPDIQDGEEGWYEKVQTRFTTHQFPDDLHVCAEIAWKCWVGKYESVADILSDIKSVEAAHTEVH